MQKLNQKMKNCITTLLIVSFVAMPILNAFPKKAEAQSIGANANGLGPLIAQLPGCIQLAKDAVSGVGDFIGNLFSSNTSNIPGSSDFVGPIQPAEDRSDFVGPPAPNLEDKATNGIAETSAVTVVIKGSAEKNIADSKTADEATAKNVAAQRKNDTCLKAIGKVMVKLLLQKLTQSMVDWINNGFNGKPAFIQSPGQFFGDIAKNEFLQFGAEMNPPELYPFARAFLQTQANAFKKKFHDNAKYSLDKLIYETTPNCQDENGIQIRCGAIAFYQNFNNGGWNAWANATLPQNNPVGFQIIASNELQDRLRGLSKSTGEIIQDSLNWSGGFLNQEHCISPAHNISRAEDAEALKTFGNNGPTAKDLSDWKYEYGNEPIPRRCTGGFENITPGKLVAEAATRVTAYPENDYLKADDLNDAIAAILDATLNHFAVKWMDEGFIALDKAFGPKAKAGGFESEPYGERRSTRTEEDYDRNDLGRSKFLQNHPNFNIRTDLTQALIDEQRTYQDKLKKQNESITDLIKVIYQLDYCIPGPHPGWYEDSQRNLDVQTNAIKSETTESLKDVTLEGISKIANVGAPIGGAIGGAALASALFTTTAVGGAAAAGATAGSVVPIVGTIIGAAVGAAIAYGIQTFSDGKDEEKVQLFYASVINGLTGIQPSWKGTDDPKKQNFRSKEGTVNVINTIYQRYANIIAKTYTTEFLPDVYKEATTKFNEVKGYNQIFLDNVDEINNRETTIKKLIEIKKGIDELNNRKSVTVGGEILATDRENKKQFLEQYEIDLKPLIKKFGRLSSGMVNGDDISNVDNLTKQVNDEKSYVYKELLKGPDGCEQQMVEIMKKIKDDFTTNPNDQEKEVRKDIFETKRMTYPVEILYDYNYIADGASIPDPWNSGYDKNKNISHNDLGPGFLSKLYFKIFGDGSSNQTNQITHPLDVWDFFGHNTDEGTKERAIGTRNDDYNGKFERVIGIY